MGGKAFGLAPAGGAGRQTDRGTLIGGLRQTIARIEDRPVLLDDQDVGEGFGPPDSSYSRPDSGPLDFGIPLEERRLSQGRVLLGIGEIDHVLAGNGQKPGLEAAAFHEVRSQGPDGVASATGFALALGGLLSRFRGPVFWVSDPRPRFEAGGFFEPGLASLGFGPGPLVRVHARSLGEALWAAGEIAATHGAGFCLLELQGNPARAGLTFSRRLALRADASGTPVILLRQGGEEEASAALTRWRIAPAISSTASFGPDRAGFLGPPAFEAVLEKCRGGRTGRWILEWDCHERHFVRRNGHIRQQAGRRAA